MQVGFARTATLVLLTFVLTACARGHDAATLHQIGASSADATASAVLQPTPTTIVSADGTRILNAPPTFDPPDGSGEQILTLTGSSSAPVTLDPALLRDAEASFLARQVFRGLVRIDEELLPQPDLAERIEIAADGLTYTFTLRSGATFQDGSPLDAHAVAASFNRACDPELAGGEGQSLPAVIYLGDIRGARERLAGESEEIAGISVLDSVTLRIDLNRPVANFLFKLAGPPGWIVDVETSINADWWQSPNGSGPFRIDSFDDDGSLEMSGWEGFWGGEPALARVTILGGADAFQPLNLYESDRIDVTSVPLYSIDRVLSPGDSLNADLVVVPQLSTTFIVLNPNLRPYDDPRVRQAIVLAFDRAKVAAVMFDGKVSEAKGLVPPGILDRDWPAQFAEYDPLEAEELLSTVSLESSRPRVFEPGGGISSSLRRILARDLNVELDVIDVDWPVFADMLTERSMDAYVLSWIADFPDPANFLTSMFRTGSPDNYLGYTNPEVDMLLDDAEVEADVERRSAFYLDAQQLIIDDGVLIPLYHDIAYTLVKPWVRGMTVTPVGILSLEDVWIDAADE